jgi:hypothetical protein
MNRPLSFGLAALGLMTSLNALADEHCTDPVTDWQPKEALRQQAEQYGWQVQRIKVDDGCYEVRGLDRKGNALEAKFSPATLQIRELEVKFGDKADTSDYLTAARKPEQPAAQSPTALDKE